MYNYNEYALNETKAPATASPVLVKEQLNAEGEADIRFSGIFCGEDKKNEVGMSFEFLGGLKTITPWDNSH